MILLLITEFILLGSQVVLKPHRTRGGDILSTYLGLTRFITTGLLIAFVESVALRAIPRTIIGAIIAVIWSLAVVILILNLVIFHVLVPLWRIVIGRRKSNESVTAVGSPSNSEGSTLEKGEQRLMLDERPLGQHCDVLPNDTGITPAPSWDRVTAGRRALNPTPNRNVLLDPEVVQAYPISPSESVSTSRGSDLPSIYTRDSGTTTVGSLLPHRWSFSIGLENTNLTDSFTASPAGDGHRSSRPPSGSQYSYDDPRSYHSQSSTPSTLAGRSEESGGTRLLEAIPEQPSQGSGLDMPQPQLPVANSSSAKGMTS